MHFIKAADPFELNDLALALDEDEGRVARLAFADDLLAGGVRARGEPAAAAQERLHVGLERAHALVARRRIAGERAHRDRAEAGREQPVLEDRRRVRHDVVAEARGVAVVAEGEERRAPREQLVEHRAEGVDVRALVELAEVRGELLRRHVRHGAAHAAARADGAQVAGVVAAALERDAPVHHVDLAVAADHHVARLEIQVQHAAAVREVDGLAHLEEHAQQALEARAVGLCGDAAAHEGGERVALDELHHEEGAARRVDVDVVDGHDVRVVEAAGDVRFGDEERDLVDARRQRRVQHLDGDAASHRVVEHVEHGAHAAGGDLASHLEARRQIVGLRERVRRWFVGACHRRRHGRRRFVPLGLERGSRQAAHLREGISFREET